MQFQKVSSDMKSLRKARQITGPETSGSNY